MAECVQNSNAFREPSRACPSNKTQMFGRMSLVFLGGPFNSESHVFEVIHDGCKTHFSTHDVLTRVFFFCSSQCLCLLADALTDNKSAQSCHLNSVSDSQLIFPPQTFPMSNLWKCPLQPCMFVCVQAHLYGICVLAIDTVD